MTKRGGRARTLGRPAGGIAIGITGETTEDLQGLSDRLARGGHSARAELLTRAYHGLGSIASVMFHRDFPGLRDRHDLESVLDESWARLTRAMESVRPPTVEAFLRLVAHKVRQVLLDMTGHQWRRDDRMRDGAARHGALPARDEPAGPSFRTRSPGLADRVPSPRREADRRPAQGLRYPFIMPDCPTPRSPGCSACTRGRSATSGAPRPNGCPSGSRVSMSR